MKMFIIILIPVLLISCEGNDPGPVISGNDNGAFNVNGLFILNEGNFTRGNGSVSFFRLDSARLLNNIFSGVNYRSPGDIPFSFTVYGDTGYLVVNNSGKIEIVNVPSMKSVKTITGLVSPRYVTMAREGTAYISSLYSDRIQILDLGTGSLKGSIDAGTSTEMMVAANGKVYAASWSEGDKISVIDAVTDIVAGHIIVTREPESMALDKNGMLWILCSGGYLGEEIPELLTIDTRTDKIVSRFRFPDGSYPTSLRFNRSGDTIYYLNNGVFRMCINDCALPALPLIEQSGRNFYKLEPSPHNSDIFVTDAADYQQKGSLLLFNSSGQLKGEWQAGIIPGNMTLKFK